MAGDGAGPGEGAGEAGAAAGAAPAEAHGGGRLRWLRLRLVGALRQRLQPDTCDWSMITLLNFHLHDEVGIQWERSCWQAHIEALEQ